MKLGLSQGSACSAIDITGHTFRSRRLCLLKEMGDWTEETSRIRGASRTLRGKIIWHSPGSTSDGVKSTPEPRASDLRPRFAPIGPRYFSSSLRTGSSPSFVIFEVELFEKQGV